MSQPEPASSPAANPAVAPAAAAAEEAPPARVLLPGAWRADGSGHAELLATRCGGCGTLTFPPVPACPHCWRRTGLRDEPLPQPGVVAAFSVVHIPAPGIPAPYAVAYVDFGSVRLCGRLESWSGLAPGDRVVAVPGLVRAGEGGELRGWLFRKAAR